MLRSPQQASRLPEVRFYGAVTRIKELSHGAEVIIFLVIHLLVHTPGRLLHTGVLEHGGDIGGSEHAGHKRQVDTGGEQRINKACSIAYEDVTIPDHLIRDVGPVPDHEGTRGESGLS